MPCTSAQSLRSISWLAAAVLAAGLTGCSSLNLPSFSPFSQGDSAPRYVGLEPGLGLQGGQTEEIYHKVRQARAENAIVLQVIGDDTPLRVLPLPPGQKSVFVSDLLNQTGVQKKLGAVDAVLYRHTTDSIGGIRMVVKMSKDKRSVRAESDYALRAGDRLHVQEAPNPGLQALIEMAGF